ncbi:MAG: class I SAM-dependent methyltransferase [Phycisphaerae bacterium]|nr:class I SAM-dependent methyltransferase [Phycisphaerae bacterium]
MDDYWKAFLRLHCDLPREGPGSDAATREAIRRLPRLPDNPVILDLGCGPGRQTLVLARAFGVPVTAVDFHEPFLAQLRASAAEAGLAEQIKTRHQSFDGLTDAPGSVDLIWCEGAIFILGFGEGLRCWRPLLRPGGCLVASEAVWLTDTPSAEVKAFWDSEYPAITNVEGNRKIAEEAGFELVDHFVLPGAAWWDEYLTPLSARGEMLRPQAATDPMLARVLDEMNRELDICRRYGDAFGYVFFILQRRE